MEMSRKKFTGLIAVVFCISLFCVIQGLIQVKNEIIFGNAEIDIAIHNYLDIPDENYITVKESSSIASLELIDNEIKINSIQFLCHKEHYCKNNVNKPSL